jgi:two-component system, chemotaxis family, sensor kinase Cph1
VTPHRSIDLEAADAERRRLAECSREPIRTPGAVQSHGTLIGIDAFTFTVRVASDNAVAMLGCPPPLGRALAEITGAEFAAQVREFVAEGGANPLTLATAQAAFDVIVHLSDDIVLIEFEPVLPRTLQQTTSALYELIQRLSHSADVQSLRNETVRQLRVLTGFDRVMMYHFHPDGHGEVIAEACGADMEPYVGLHFPASDIPAQARELYLTKLSRAIVGTSGESADLLTIDDDSGTDRMLDLSAAELRSVSPHHLQFMRNMGQDSTLSFSMVRDGALIGMITCAHRSSLRLPFIVRRGIEVLAGQVALQLSAIGRVERLQRQAAVRTTRARLLTQIAGADDFAASLVRGRLTVRDVIAADGAAVHIDGRTRTTGVTPTSVELEVLHEAISSGSLANPFVSDGLSLQHPQLASALPTVTGVLVVPIGGAGDYLAFFRDEVLREVKWLGDQTTANRQTPLSPRNSFSAWSASVTRTSLPWDDVVDEAIELGRDVEGALLRKIESELALLALRDALTGLPNRRGLMESLQLALTEPGDDELSVLFIDLDRFKEINDTYGHDVGDAVLIEVARRVHRETRAEDTVARLGGDEFVLLCHGTDHDAAAVVADRVGAAIAEPMSIGDVVLAVTASVGATTVRRDEPAAGVLRAADQAMYRVKESRRD